MGMYAKNQDGHRAKFRDKNKCFLRVLFPICAVLCRILTSSILHAGLVKAFLKAKGHTKLKNSFCFSLRVFQSEIRPTNIFLTDCEILWSFQTFQIWEAQ